MSYGVLLICLGLGTYLVSVFEAAERVRAEERIRHRQAQIRLWALLVAYRRRELLAEARSHEDSEVRRLLESLK